MCRFSEKLFSCRGKICIFCRFRTDTVRFGRPSDRYVELEPSVVPRLLQWRFVVVLQVAAIGIPRRIDQVLCASPARDWPVVL